MTRNLREEVNIAPYVDRGVIDIHDKAVRDNINTFLNGALGQSFLTPYIALERVRKVLANFHIHIPGIQFLEGDHNVEVFPVNQFGDVKGMRNTGEVVTRVAQPYYIFFEYKMNDKGLFAIFSQVVDEDDLKELMDDATDDMDDDDSCDDRSEKLEESSESVDMAGPETGPKPYPGGPKVSAIIAMALQAKKKELEESTKEKPNLSVVPKGEETFEAKVKKFKDALEGTRPVGPYEKPATFKVVKESHKKKV